jgi:predicted AlkP superfamily phosphohydrolase/phosphomutase/tetratricopeptide (TPR) repeat protein
MRAKKLLLIGLDAADWHIIDDLAGRGALPNFSALIKGGVRGNIQTLYPPYSPCLWTSIATGKRMHKHGIMGFYEPDATSRGVRPVSSLSRKTKALWNIFNQKGLRSNVVGWWPSQPVEAIRGAMVSDLFCKAPEASGPWPVEEGMVHPAGLTETLQELRMSKFDVTGDLLLPFIPKLSKVDQNRDLRLVSLAKILAETATTHAVATEIMQTQPWDFMAVYYDGLDHFGHGFMKYAAPKSPSVSDSDFELYQHVLDGAYRYFDMMLGTLVHFAGPEADIVVVSDHGFHNDHLRPHSISSAPAGPSAEHREFGIIAMKGPDFATGGKQIFAATLLDVAPTILHAFGLPVGRDMDGKALAHAFAEKREVEYIESWDKVEGESAMLRQETARPAKASATALRQLEELGYISRQGNSDFTAELAARELEYNEALSQISGGEHDKAYEIAKRLAASWPEESRFNQMVLQCEISLGLCDRIEATFGKMERDLRHYSAEAAIRHDAMVEACRKQGIEDLALLGPNQKKELAQLKRHATVDEDGLAFFKAKTRLALGDADGALEIFLKLTKTAWPGRLVSLHTIIGDMYFKRADVENASVHYAKAVELDPDCAAAHLGLARCLLAKRRTFDAASHALASLELVYDNPLAHFVYARCLRILGHAEWAAEAFEMAIAINPHFLPAYKPLALLYEKRLHKPELAAEWRKREQEAAARVKDKAVWNATDTATEEDGPEPDVCHYPETMTGKARSGPQEYIIVVTGLPRSGTSLAMQLLTAGGISAMTDGLRKADESNRKGYYELEAAKGIERDASWLKEARGKAVKIVVPLVKFLPPQYSYKVIFMKRDLTEIMRSQQAMLGRSGKPDGGRNARDIEQYYVLQSGLCADALAALPYCDVMTLDYAEIIKKPFDTIERLVKFLSNPELSTESMSGAVDPALYRERS